MKDNEMEKCNQCVYSKICHEECEAICEIYGKEVNNG
jgi:radical SAM protein with 4Fe4S-binding SPASM domain